MGLRTVPQTVIFKNAADLLAAVKRGELTIVSLPAIDYLKIRNEVRMTPFVVSSSNAGKARQFILLVRRDSGIRTVADLRGKTVLILPATKHEVCHLWLDVLLIREGNRDRSTFLRQVKEANSASQAIMALFFRQTDAAIVSRGAFETAMDLNPQIGNQLSVISESKSLLGDITCIPDSVNDKLRISIEYAALHLHERAIGRQIFTLFKIDRTISYQPSYISGVSDLLKEYARLKAKAFKREQ
jgi:phosphonate transport system substrate-binding protein